MNLHLLTSVEVRSPNPLGEGTPLLPPSKATLPNYRPMFLSVFEGSASASFSMGRRRWCCISCRTDGSTGVFSTAFSICCCCLGLSGAPSSRCGISSTTESLSSLSSSAHSSSENSLNSFSTSAQPSSESWVGISDVSEEDAVDSTGESDGVNAE